MGLRALAAVLLAASLLIASCSRTRTARPAGSPAPVTGTQPRVTAIAPAVAPADTKARTTSLGQAPPPQSVPQGEVGIYGLLALGAQEAAMPEDFLIGPMGDSRNLTGDERGAWLAASTFLDALCRGSVPRDLLAAPSREELAAMLGYAVEHGEVPASWRLGSPRRIRGEMICAVRLIGAPGTAEGDLYLAKDAGSWMVADFQINLAQLSAPRPERGRRFFPSPYRWLLGE